MAKDFNITPKWRNFAKSGHTESRQKRNKTDKKSGGSPGLVVMGGDSCCKGREFESQHRKLDRHYFTFICCKNYDDVCLKRRK